MLSRKKRVLIIIQLIFAFSFLVWLFIKPYVMEVVAKKSQNALYEMVMEKHELFETLSFPEQQAIREGYEKGSTPHIPTETPPFALAWIFFAILLSILVLFQIEGAEPATWLLPALVLGFGYFLYTAPPKKFEGLFPAESYVRERYVQESGNGRNQLLRGWHLYLIHEWTGESPSTEEAVFKQQVERGLFAFNVARLRWIQEGKGDEVVIAGFASPPSLFRLLTYFLWNLLFAWLITKKSPSVLQSNPS